MTEPTPLVLTQSDVGGEVGVWGPDVNGNWALIGTWSAAETAARLAGDAARPTFDQMDTAIAAAIAAAFQAF